MHFLSFGLLRVTHVPFYIYFQMPAILSALEEQQACARDTQNKAQNNLHIGPILIGLCIVNLFHPSLRVVCLIQCVEIFGSHSYMKLGYIIKK